MSDIHLKRTPRTMIIKVGSQEEKALNEFLEQNPSKQEILDFIKGKAYSSTLMGKIIEALSFVDEEGVGQVIDLKELSNYSHSFLPSNGRDYLRKSGGYLGDKYILKKERDGAPVRYVQIIGFNEKDPIDRSIRQDIRDELLVSDAICPITLSRRDLEIDHKDDTYPIHTTTPSLQKVEHFQVLSRSANAFKREINERKKRGGPDFDVREIGYLYQEVDDGKGGKTSFLNDVHTYREGVIRETIGRTVDVFIDAAIENPTLIATAMQKARKNPVDFKKKSVDAIMQRIKNQEDE